MQPGTCQLCHKQCDCETDMLCGRTMCFSGPPPPLRCAQCDSQDACDCALRADETLDEEEEDGVVIIEEPEPGTLQDTEEPQSLFKRLRHASPDSRGS